ncbi:TBC1 domain family member 5 homolog A-like [Bombina bombina]|uniref:TBC1 domain family member 5 homolog A-like n=1 Tax=Bombina bombina TaxID=8345 RepID=UPI00235AA117|nr:TBC1 domain family member 5 homolog A-like [Bombina bombina]
MLSVSERNNKRLLLVSHVAIPTTISDTNVENAIDDLSIHALFARLEEAINTECRHWLDSEMLQKYLDKKQIPRGLRLFKSCSFKDNPEILNKWEEAMNECSHTFMKILISHRKTLVEQMTKEIETIQTSLDKFKNSSLYDELNDMVLQKTDRYQKDLIGIKNRKLIRDDEDYSKGEVYSFNKKKNLPIPVAPPNLTSNEQRNNPNPSNDWILVSHHKNKNKKGNWYYDDIDTNHGDHQQHREIHHFNERSPQSNHYSPRHITWGGNPERSREQHMPRYPNNNNRDQYMPSKHSNNSSTTYGNRNQEPTVLNASYNNNNYHREPRFKGGHANNHPHYERTYESNYPQRDRTYEPNHTGYSGPSNSMGNRQNIPINGNRNGDYRTNQGASTSTDTRPSNTDSHNHFLEQGQRTPSWKQKSISGYLEPIVSLTTPQKGKRPHGHGETGDEEQPAKRQNYRH